MNLISKLLGKKSISEESKYNSIILNHLEKLVVTNPVKKRIFYHIRKNIFIYDDKFRNYKFTKERLQSITYKIEDEKTSDINYFRSNDYSCIYEPEGFIMSIADWIIIQNNFFYNNYEYMKIASKIYYNSYFWKCSINNIFKKIHEQIPKLFEDADLICFYMKYNMKI